MLKLLKKSQVDHKGKIKNPDELPAYRRWHQVRKFVRQGMTEEAAMAKYDEPIGLCRRVVGTEVVDGVEVPQLCGKVSDKARGRICRDHIANDLARRSREFRQDKKHWIAGVCRVPGCNKPFFGHKLRENCDEHSGQRVGRNQAHPGSRPMGRPRKEPRPTPVYVEPKESPFPPTWDRPLPEHLLPQPKSEPVKITGNMKVTFLPSTVPDRRCW